MTSSTSTFLKAQLATLGLADSSDLSLEDITLGTRPPSAWEFREIQIYDEECAEYDEPQRLLVCEWWLVNGSLYAIALTDSENSNYKVFHIKTLNKVVWAELVPGHWFIRNSLKATRLSLLGLAPSDFQEVGVLEELVRAAERITETTLEVNTGA